MDSVATWLDQLGLGQYATTFEASALDLVAIGRLSDTELKDLGVVALGHRKQLLDAINVLRRQGETPRGSGTERRHLTVLFCDIVDSTALSARLDPEDLASLIADYQRCCAAAAQRFDGFVARYVGDGILVYFGYPNAHEDSAERAVRTALAIVQTIGRIENASNIQLQVRLGIATGLVVVGTLPGGAPERHAVVGETPNLASRLQGIAKPNTVVIAASTHLRVSKLFNCSELPPVSLKGFLAPIKAWQVLGERAHVTRFEARRAAGLIPYFGRVAELNALTECWQSAQAGAGRLILIKGEPGIGKSRLVQELTDRIVANTHYRIDYIGSPISKNSPFGPVIAQLTRAAGFVHDNSPQRKREKIEAMLTAEQEVICATAPILASLLSIPAAPQDPPADTDPQRRKRQVLETLVNRLLNLATRKPVVLVCEDAQWFDPTTRELMDLLVDRSATSSVLVVVTFRPEFVPKWSAWHHAIELTLHPLDGGLAAAMVEEVAKRTPLPWELVSRIVERSDGNPLYIEELTIAVLESNPNSTSDGVVLVDRDPRYAPGSVGRALASRCTREGSRTNRGRYRTRIPARFCLRRWHRSVNPNFTAPSIGWST